MVLGEALRTREKILDGVRLALFDWSGVISDDRIPVHEANMRMQIGYGIPRISLPEWLLLTKQSAVEYFAFLGIDVTPEEIAERYQKEYKAVVAEGKLQPVIYPDVEKTLKEINVLGIQAAVISSHPHEVLIAEAQNYEIDGLFSKINGSVRNKATEITTIASELAISLTGAIYIGDAISDVRFAKTAGVRSVAITTGYHNRDQLLPENPDFLINRLSDLLVS